MIALQILAENHFGISTTTALGVSLIILASVSPFILVGVVYFMKKRLEHKQIMAAIEKGMPLSEIMPSKPRPVGPAWIKQASVGIALVLIGLGAFVSGGEPGVLVSSIVLGVGAGFLTRGVLYQRYNIRERTGLQEAEKPEN